MTLLYPWLPPANAEDEARVVSRCDEQAMLQEVSRKEKVVFEELFRELYGPVVGFFAKKGYSREDSQDLAAETFMRAYRSFGDFRGDAKPLTWLYTIAANVWHNRMRDAAAAKRDGVEVQVPDDGRSDPVFQDQAHDRTVSKERRRLLKSAIDKLPPGMRRCVWLRVYQDMSYRDISEILGVTVSTAKSQVSLAGPRLRPLLAEHYPELDDDLGDLRKVR